MIKFTPLELFTENRFNASSSYFFNRRCHGYSSRAVKLYFTSPLRVTSYFILPPGHRMFL